MACIMIRIEDRTTGNPTVDASNWKAGDVIEVAEDTACGSAVAPNSPWWLIIVPSFTVAQVLKFLESHSDENGNLILRRKWKIDLTKIPTTMLNQLIVNKKLTITKASEINNFKNAVYDKINDVYGM